MPQFAANLTTLFTEWAFLDRFEAAADHGFSAVEFQFPTLIPPEAIAERLRAEKLTLALFNAPAGDEGERGLAALAGRADAFRASLAQAKRYAEILDPRAIHVMAGIADPADAGARKAYVGALVQALERLDGVDVLIEPLNGRDMPGYFLNSFVTAAQIIAEVGHPRLKLQYDIYHRQILHGDVLASLQALLPIIGHVQIAAAPLRHEPDSGELDDARVLGRLDALGYRGFVGCEYHPAKGTVAGLGWLEAWRRRRHEGEALTSTWRDRL